MESQETQKMKKDAEAMEENQHLPLASLQLLKEHESKWKRFNRAEMNEQRSCRASSSSGSQILSTESIMKMARARLLQCTCQNSDVFSCLIDDSFVVQSGLPSDRQEDFELALLLQASALKLSNGQFERARKLLKMCEQFTSATGNPIQRVAYYFAEALHARIYREMNMILPKEHEQNRVKPTVVEEFLTSPLISEMKYEQELAIGQIFKLTAMQAILESVASAKRVHLVDLGMRSGSQWMVLMQALADLHERPLELLKLTAVATSKEKIKDVGTVLSSFAEAMSIPFSFKMVLSSMESLKEDLFDLEAGEIVVVYSFLRLACLLPWPDRLESLVSTLKNLQPSLMVILELEANTNSSVFIDRFNEAFSLCSGFFDYYEDIMDRDNQLRAIMEGVFLRGGIQNVITTEGEERVCRQERIEFWRALFARFGFVEMQLSHKTLHQAYMVLESNPRWSSCTLDRDRKSLIVCCGGTPIESLSFWKLQND